MRKIFILGILLVLGIGLDSFRAESGISKLRVGNEFFEKVFGIVSQKIIELANNMKSSVPDVNVDTTILKSFSLKANLTKILIEDFVYDSNQLQITHSGVDTVTIKLSKINYY